MTEEQKRLEKALLDLIERIGKEQDQVAEVIAIIPGLAHELNVLWNTTR